MPDRTAQRIEFGRVGRCIVEANFDGGDLRFAANQLRILLASQHPLRAVFLHAARTLAPRTSPSALPGTLTNKRGQGAIAPAIGSTPSKCRASAQASRSALTDSARNRLQARETGHS
jgi:hypothetical protein